MKIKKHGTKISKENCQPIYCHQKLMGRICSQFSV